MTRIQHLQNALAAILSCWIVHATNALSAIPVIFDSSNVFHRDLQYHPEQPSRITETVKALLEFQRQDGGDASSSPTIQLMDVAEEPRQQQHDLLVASSSTDESGGSTRTIVNEPFSPKELEHAKQMLEAAHSKELVSQLETKCNNGRERRVSEGKEPLGHMGYLDFDTYLTTESFAVCLRATAAWIRAVDLALGHSTANAAMALTRPPGHHATRDTPNGFCLFNFAAAAALHVLLLAQDSSKRVSVLDWDVHYGQGVADILQHYPNARYVSMHQTPAFPYMGERLGVSGENRNVLTIPVQAESSWTCGYKDAMEKALEFVSKRGEWSPDVVIVCAGYDALDSDELASCSLQAKDFGKMSKCLRQHLEKEQPSNFPALVFGLEGGYQLASNAGGGNLQQAVWETLQGLTAGNLESNVLAPKPRVPKKKQSGILIHWKGEDMEGYSLQFRTIEFRGALSAVLTSANDDKDDETIPSTTATDNIAFVDALHYMGSLDDGYMPPHKLDRFNSALQYLVYDDRQISLAQIQQAVERCSLIHAAYQTVAEADSYESLSEAALASGGFDDMQPGHEHDHDTWCVRVRYYGSDKKEKRHGERTRSVSLERVALQALKPLLLTFGGGVDLKNPDCKLYVMDGLLSRKNTRRPTKVLARRLAMGSRVSSIAPATRLCVTNTPLCAMSATLLCNAAQIQPGFSLLDPFSGSGTIFLAASKMLQGDVKSVGIDIAHNGLVNRRDIAQDFATRQLVPPLAMLQGDSSNVAVREEARRALCKGDVESTAFDCIITDPPYGIRESTNYNQKRPIQELLASIVEDRESGHRLLKKGGKLVCFLPCTSDESLEEDVLPIEEELEAAGLVITELEEQPLNDNLSRWLTVFDCVF